MAKHTDNTVGRLNQKQLSLIFGSLLGDGYMRTVEGRKDAFLEINHSIKAKKYVDWKFNILKNICISEPKERNTNEGRVAYRFFTRQSDELTKIHRLFYKNKRKVIPKSLVLDPMMLAVWYMDDGSKTSASDIYLNTQQFGEKDQKYLLHLLRQMDVKARLNKDKKYYRIRILKESIKTFMDIIKDNIEDSMRYKLI